VIRDEIDAYRQEKAMAFMNTVERVGMRKALLRGVEIAASRKGDLTPTILPPAIVVDRAAGQ
jgi:hypothetical protein